MPCHLQLNTIPCGTVVDSSAGVHISVFVWEVMLYSLSSHKAVWWCSPTFIELSNRTFVTASTIIVSPVFVCMFVICHHDFCKNAMLDFSESCGVTWYYGLGRNVKFLTPQPTWFLLNLTKTYILGLLTNSILTHICKWKHIWKIC